MEDSEKLFFCKQCKSLKLGGKLNAVKKLGACRRCLECHDEGNDCKSTYLCSNRNCKKGSSSDHHFFLYPKAVTCEHEMDKSAKDFKKRPNTFTEEQKQFLDEFSPSNTGQKNGILIDLASDTNYITHRAAKRLGLASEKVTLVVYGVGGIATSVNSLRYHLRVRVIMPQGTEKAYQLICYGLDEIAQVRTSVRPEQIQK